MGAEILHVPLFFSVGWLSIATMLGNVLGFDVFEATVGGGLRADGRLLSKMPHEVVLNASRCAFFFWLLFLNFFSTRTVDFMVLLQLPK